MSAVVGVLNESLTESIRGFYKLRKAYVTLSGILEVEANYMKRRDGLDVPSRTSVDLLGSNRSAPSVRGMPGALRSESVPVSRTPSLRSIPNESLHHGDGGKGDTIRNDNADDDEDEFFDADDDFASPDKHATYDGHLEMNGTTGKLDGMTIGNKDPKINNRPTPSEMPLKNGTLAHDPDSDIFANPIDVFIHSGANLCFGLLLVMISMIPPAFSKLLFIIGFNGDRDRGLRMLWQASKFHNINGAMAGLIVLGHYNTFMGFSDIIPDSDFSVVDPNSIDGYPRERCEALLADMRSRHPASHLWLLEEARMEAGRRKLSTAISIIEGSSKSPLRQVEAIKMFEKALDAMYSHDYTLCAASFIACVSYNNWSHSLYYYIAGASNIELYRQHKTTDPAIAATYAEKAEELLRIAPKHAGKKKIFARQLPFDNFATRKVQKWETRAKEWNIPLVEAVGVSPIEEMILLWNGYKRMAPSQLQFCLDRLAWSESSSNPTWCRESADEKAILAVLRGATLRNLGRWDDAKAALTANILEVDKAELKGGLRDDWTAPVAHYEMGVVCWMQRGEVARAGGNRAEEERWVKECEGWVEKAAKWEAFELDARIGLKIATAQDTLRRWREGRCGKRV